VKDCLKYQFQVEAHENPKDDSALKAGQDKLWHVIRRIANWIGGTVGTYSGGRLRLSEGMSPPSSAALEGHGGRAGHNAELELEDREHVPR